MGRLGRRCQAAMQIPRQLRADRMGPNAGSYPDFAAIDAVNVRWSRCNSCHALLGQESRQFSFYCVPDMSTVGGLKAVQHQFFNV